MKNLLNEQKILADFLWLSKFGLTPNANTVVKAADEQIFHNKLRKFRDRLNWKYSVLWKYWRLLNISTFYHIPGFKQMGTFQPFSFVQKSSNSCTHFILLYNCVSLSVDSLQKIPIYIFIFEAWDVKKGQKVQAPPIHSRGTVFSKNYSSHCHLCWHI